MYNSDEYKNYDHIHWSIINSNPIDKHMGTTTDEENSKDTGKIVLLGRTSSGFHHILHGPISQKTYWKIKEKKYAELIK